MSARAVPPAQDPIRPQPATGVEIEFEGRTYRGVLGQSIAGAQPPYSPIVVKRSPSW